MPDKDGKMTIEKLAEMSQKEFLSIGERFNKVDGDLASLRAELKEEMATKQELAAVRSDLKAAIDSSADRVVGEIKEFMQPHISGLDAALVDIEKLKERIKT